MTVLDLQHLDQVEKQEGFAQDFQCGSGSLVGRRFWTINQNLVPSSRKLPRDIWIRHLSNTVLVIDGFTRFSAERRPGAPLE